MSVTYEEFRSAIRMLQEAEQYLHRVGLHSSAKTVNEAINRLGWEFAEKAAQRREEGR